MKGKLLFREEQTFRYTWSWWLMAIISLPTVGLFSWGIFQQLVLGIPWGTKPMPDLGLVLTTVFVWVLLGGVFIFIHWMKLVVHVDRGGISYSFWPFQSHMRTIHRKEIQQAEVKKYNPILDFGGWGYRMGLSGRAINVKGNMGLQLTYGDKKRLLLGTQQPEELRKAIAQMMAGE